MKALTLCLRLALPVVLAVAWTSPALAQKLVLNIDQGYARHLVYKADTPAGRQAIANTVAVLKKYRDAGVDAHALVNPQADNKDKLIYLLDRLRDARIPFAFDAMTPDCLPGHSADWTVNGVPYNAPYDRKFGMPLRGNYPWGDPGDNRGILHYMRKYPNLKGFRLMEPEHIYQHHLKNGWNVDDVSFWLESYVSAAHSHGMWVQYNSSTWEPDTSLYSADQANSLPGKAARDQARQRVLWLCEKYPGTIYPSYATNDGHNTHRLRLRSVHGTPLTPWRGLVTFTGMKGHGISIQSWMTGAKNPADDRWYTQKDMPVELLLQFVNDAKNAPRPGLIQLESPDYFFNTATSGKATREHGRVARALAGVALEDTEPRR